MNITVNNYSEHTTIIQIITTNVSSKLQQFSKQTDEEIKQMLPNGTSLTHIKKNE
jgi:hypothetical protein